MQFGLTSIKQKSSYLNSLESFGIEDFKIEKLGLEKGYKIGFNEDNGQFSVETAIDFIYNDKNQNQTKLFGVTIELQFHFIDFEGIIKVVDEGVIDVPDKIVVNLVSIAYSTARGVLHSLTAKSDYDGIYLPLTNPKEFQETLKGKD